MKVFILGLNKSGKTTVAQALSEHASAHYISAYDWLKSTFRPRHEQEDADDYDREQIKFVADRLRQNPQLCVDNVNDVMRVTKHADVFIIDGVLSPRDFAQLFDYNIDIAIFLNRTDNPEVTKDYEGVSINVMRDYCLWLVTMGLLSKDRWLEFNYRLPGEESDFVKTLGNRNTVTIVKSINKAIDLIKRVIWHQDPIKNVATT